MAGHFTNAFIAIGVCLTVVTLMPAVYFYIKYSDESVKENPYTLDLSKPELHDSDSHHKLDQRLLNNGRELNDVDLSEY